MDWDAYGHVSASQYRVAIVRELDEGPRTPKQIADAHDFHLSHVSNYLSGLSGRDIVECVTPDRSKGRVYRLTELGDWIAESLPDER